MAVLFMDGYAGGDSSSGKWDPGSVGYTPQTASPRSPGGYYASWGSWSDLYKFIPASTKVILGTGYKVDPSYGTDGYIDFLGDGGGTQHIRVRWSGGFIYAYRGGTLIGSGTTPIPLGSWFYLEVSVTISDTVGEVHVRLNGSPTDEISFTGDTKNGGTASTIDRLRFNTGSPGALGGIYLTDTYVLNDTGPAPLNNFLGDVTVRTLSPNGNGTYSQLTNSAGNSTNNYTYVDEHAYSSTDYVGSATPGQKDTYALQDLPAAVTSIYAIQVTGQLAKADASLAQARYVLRSGGADYTATSRTLSTTYITYSDSFSTDPATGAAWTLSGINNLEAGVEVV